LRLLSFLFHCFYLRATPRIFRYLDIRQGEQRYRKSSLRRWAFGRRHRARARGRLLTIRKILDCQGIEMYGLGNWNEVAEHMGAKSKAEYIEHYNRIYMDSPFFPLPDLSHVMGKSREELLAMVKEHASVSEEVVAKEEPIISTKNEIEEPRNEALAGGSSPTLTAGRSAIPKTSVGASQQPSVEAQARRITVAVSSYLILHGSPDFSFCFVDVSPE
ncbi:hypothetical protein Droror1_Dr00020129, partial [Drosera rotundifolia]